MAALRLRRRLDTDGYLLIRNLLPRKAVLDAHQCVASQLQRLGWLRPEAPLEECHVDVASFPHPSAGSVGTIPGVGEWSEELGHTPELLRVTEAPEVVALCERLFGEPCTTWYKKWLRTVPPGEATAFHMDGHLFCHPDWGSSLRTLSAWLPLHDIDLELGGLALLEGSNRLSGFKTMHETYAVNDERVAYLPDPSTGQGDWPTGGRETNSVYPGGLKLAANGSVALFCDPNELSSYDPQARWVSTAYRAGDVLLFPMLTMHGSVTNTATDRYFEHD